MKFIFTLLLSITLTGCAWLKPKLTAAKPPFPEAIPELTQPCPDLETIKGDQVAITELMKSVVNNYVLYYKCSLKNDSWNDWYKKQKEIYDKVK